MNYNQPQNVDYFTDYSKGRHTHADHVEDMLNVLNSMHLHN